MSPWLNVCFILHKCISRVGSQYLLLTADVNQSRQSLLKGPMVSLGQRQFHMLIQWLQNATSEAERILQGWGWNPRSSECFFSFLQIWHLATLFQLFSHWCWCFGTAMCACVCVFPFQTWYLHVISHYFPNFFSLFWHFLVNFPKCLKSPLAWGMCLKLLQAEMGKGLFTVWLLAALAFSSLNDSCQMSYFSVKLCDFPHLQFSSHLHAPLTLLTVVDF